MTILGLSLREHLGGRWAMSWSLVLAYLPIGLLAPLGNITTAEPGTGLGSLLLASALSLVLVVGIMAISDVTWMRHRREHPLPIWSIVLLGTVLGASRSAAMYAASLALGLQSPDQELAIMRTITGTIQGATVYPLAVLLISVIARYRHERRRLLADESTLAHRIETDEQLLSELRASVLDPLTRDLNALDTRLLSDQIDAADAAREVRERAHALWNQARQTSTPRVRWSAALVASLRRRPFSTALVVAVWFPTAVGTSLAVGDGPRLFLRTLIGTAVMVVTFEVANALVRRLPATVWAVVPVSLALVAVVTSPPGSLAGDGLETAATTYFIINLCWLALLTVGGATVTGAVRQGESILAELHDRVDAEATLAARWEEDRRDILEDIATTLHGRLQSRLTTSDSGHASTAIRETLSLLREPARHIPADLPDAVHTAAAPWVPLMTISVDVSGSASPATALLTQDVLEEALSNAFRHGDASTVDIRVVADSQGVCIDVRDNGIYQEGAPGMGSRLFDRAGNWTRSATAEGTRVTVTIRPENC